MAEKANLFEYNDDSVKTLDWREHIRLRPGMYIGKLGDGSSPDDGIYVLLKEVIDNCIDEYTMGYGKQVDISIEQEDRHRTRLWPRHSAGKGSGCGQQDQYRAPNTTARPSKSRLD